MLCQIRIRCITLRSLSNGRTISHIMNETGKKTRIIKTPPNQSNTDLRISINKFINNSLIHILTAKFAKILRKERKVEKSCNYFASFVKPLCSLRLKISKNASSRKSCKLQDQKYSPQKKPLPYPLAYALPLLISGQTSQAEDLHEENTY